MTDWTAGYVADIGYTFGYYAELNPLRMRLPFVYAGLRFPEVHTACELGFGQGVSINLHAAASGISWHGTDFNPSQAAFACELAGASGSGASLRDEAFAEFCARTDLPDFDFIGLHGIWSWVSDANRAVVVEFLRRKLKVGGVLYISYNTLPGWSTFAPLRHLMTRHAEVLGARGVGTVPRIDAALEFTERLLATQPMYALANPQAAEKLKAVKQQNRHYLAHEYFNRDWHPMHVATMAEWLEPAKLQYACSANALEHVDPLHLSPEQSALLAEIPDPLLRESVRDFMVNAQFRRDYWVKGVRKMDLLERAEALRAQTLLMTAQRADVSLKVAGARGEAQLQEAIYGPLLDLMADHQPRSVAEIEQRLKPHGIAFGQLLQATLVLSATGALMPVQDAAEQAAARERTQRLNVTLARKSRAGGDIAYLASPVTGGGINVPRFSQLFLLARAEGCVQREDWVRYVWNVLAAQEQRLMRDGQPLATEEDNLAELRAMAEQFERVQLPALQALGVA
jgi:SAM-dependent methyltransferase